MDGYRHLESMGGGVDLYLDEASRDIVVAIKTEIGTVTTALTPEAACRFGISLIRESGKRYVFKSQPARTAPSKEEKHESETDDSNGGGGAPREPIELYGSSVAALGSDNGPTIGDAERVKSEGLTQRDERRSQVGPEHK